jgi:hypothetical protein
VETVRILPTPRAFLAFLFSALLVSSLAMGGAMGPELEQTVEQASVVGTGEGLLVTAAVAGTVGVGAYMAGALATAPAEDTYSAEEVAEIKNASKEQTRIDLWQRAQALNASQSSFLTTMKNALTDARGAVWLKVEATIAETIETETDVNGDGVFDRDDVRVAARQEIKDYYALKQRNLLSDWNRSVASVEYMVGVNANESLSRATPSEFAAVPDTNTNSDMFSNISAEAHLVDGSEVPVHVVGHYYDSQGKFFVYAPASDGDIHRTEDTPGSATISQKGYKSHPGNEVSIQSPDGSDKIWPLGKNGRYPRVWDVIESQASQMLANANSTADGVYDSYLNDEFEAEEFVSAASQASEWATNYSETGYQAYSVATLASAGYDTPNLSETGRMNVSYELAADSDTHVVTFGTVGTPDSGAIRVGGLDRRVEIANATEGETEDSLTMALPSDLRPGVSTADGETYRTLNLTKDASTTIGNVTVFIESIESSVQRSETGLLYASDAPSGGWQVNTTYDGANLSGTVLWAARGGQMIDLSDQTFTVNSAHSESGEELQQVEMREYTYKTSNISELQQAYDDLLEVRQEQQERIQQVGGGGGGSGSGSVPLPMVAVGIAGVALLLGLSQRGGGGGRPPWR